MDKYQKNYQEIVSVVTNQVKKWQQKRPEILAVSKKRSVDEIIDFIEATDHRSFAENYVKEAEEKYQIIKQSYPKIKLHLIGHLQSNKALEAVRLFDVIETIDSYKLAKKLDQVEQELGIKREYLIQVNIGEEQQKSGVMPKDVSKLIDEIRENLSINVKGLMCIPPQDKNPSIYFAYLKKLSVENQITYLSMGMSADFDKAIAVGTDEIRIGTALFV